MTDMVRKRRFLHSTKIQPSPVFFRSKLSHPLSPKTPAVLVDVIMRKHEDDFDDVEKSLYISLYDMTYRHDLKDSCWLDRLKGLSETKEVREEQKDSRQENTTVVNVSKSDCYYHRIHSRSQLFPLWIALFHNIGLQH